MKTKFLAEGGFAGNVQEKKCFKQLELMDFVSLQKKSDYLSKCRRETVGMIQRGSYSKICLLWAGFLFKRQT